MKVIRQFSKQLGLVLLTSSIGWSTIAAPTDVGAEAFLRNVYKRYQVETASSPTGADAPKLFTRELVRLLRKDQASARGEEGKVNFDPICDCQDYGDFILKMVRVSNKDKRSVRAKVAFVNGGERRDLTIDLKRETDGWRISDIYRGRGKSLKQLLRSSG